jgi:hypothetical protein
VKVPSPRWGVEKWFVPLLILLFIIVGAMILGEAINYSSGFFNEVEVIGWKM